MSQIKTTNERQNGQGQPPVPDPEGVVGPTRRRFSREYKLRILAEVERCRRGEIGALLRREGLYSSTLSRWRQQKAAGKLDEGAEEQRQERQAQRAKIKRLRRENARLKAELNKKEAIIEVQKNSQRCWQLSRIKNGETREDARLGERTQCPRRYPCRLPGVRSTPQLVLSPAGK